MFPIVELIDEIENALKTPVQATVKREDEQAFARLNGSNLMFCEDAGRRIQTALNADERILDFWARCTHYESLHPHNAVSVVTKGVEGGYVAGAGAPVRLELSRSQTLEWPVGAGSLLGFGCRQVPQQQLRVHAPVQPVHAPVQVGSRGPSGCADLGDHLTCLHLSPRSPRPRPGCG
jgi:hypothetical protein